ncbi:hypothetical protein ACJX0J_012275, partial [Zea mays]
MQYEYMIPISQKHMGNSNRLKCYKNVLGMNSCADEEPFNLCLVYGMKCCSRIYNTEATIC